MLETTVALAQRDGLEALTMRRLADEVGAAAMTLYHYVPNKEALLDGMVDVVFGEIELPTTDVDWKTALRRRAVSTREALNRHRWAVGLMESRTTPGPATLRLHNAVLRVLREAGFSIEQTIEAYSVQDAYIYGLRASGEERSVRGRGRGRGGRRGAVRGVRRARGGAPARRARRSLPYLAEVVAGHVAKVGHDFAKSFEYGLDLIPDALERLRGD